MGFTEVLLIFSLIGGLIYLFVTKKETFKNNNEIPNTWKGRTVVYAVLAFIIPLWIITLPLFLYLAYKSYKEGGVKNKDKQNTSYTLSDIKEAQILLKDKVIIQEEFDKIKTNALNK